jgi:Calcineurin-like phosphoesterase
MPMTRVLAVADEESSLAYRGGFDAEAIDLIVACGDLGHDYLEYLVTVVGHPLLFVSGNHDPAPPERTPIASVLPIVHTEIDDAPRPHGCINIDGRVIVAGGLRIGGLGGSRRYSEGPHQYTEPEMGRRCRKLARKAKRMRPRRQPLLDLVVTHAPPLGVGDADDLPHKGFNSFHELVARTSPKVLVHGHIHPYGLKLKDHTIGTTTVVNAVGYRVLEFD